MRAKKPPTSIPHVRIASGPLFEDLPRRSDLTRPAHDLDIDVWEVGMRAAVAVSAVVAPAVVGRGPAIATVAREPIDLDDLPSTEGSVTKPSVIERLSPNESSRGGADIDAIVLHHTGDNSTEGALSWLTSRRSGVSAHYLVGRSGVIYQLVPDSNKAWHAGKARLHGESSPGVNARSIGIEIVNDGSGHTPFTDEQYDAINRLVRYLASTYDVPVENIVGHKDVAIPAGRKTDPASNFDWERALSRIA